ncbi:MAG: PTS sugar transporter subunit IIA [Erysipelotrichaceae bacterium]|jgi:mannose/fructose/sorbose-specific phosphotransferase system IIA component|nr:PTS sugar transporter subunit IIA [Erysipelotrichaceae bacterium]MBQ1287969.1 PTS sugar transporter subunit IIA [Erysipelotrichaceae bacterium]MBQ1379589.1 PTS sugar transporter subunit IIA [Erysipelotrichaceae bacterium]MBQ1625090.1 PTS sugar transporter subunit IIA [Erysipelotrichaceae bacterium]MBQ1692399.1 PTS sugar transporter subunit IIA [Erysipelotrichaceae bacterium]
MKGIVITSHGPMAQGILETSKLFFGEQPQIKACCLSAEDNPDDFVNVLKDAVKEVDTGDGVIVFCDMLFGSPCNCMARIIAEDMESDKVQVITGVNLAMILQILSVREANDVDVAELLKAGNDGIADLKAILKANM